MIYPRKFILEAQRSLRAFEYRTTPGRIDDLIAAVKELQAFIANLFELLGKSCVFATSSKRVCL
jgi:hypothetical protein